MNATPIRYLCSVEKPIADGSQIYRELMDTMLGIHETTSRDDAHARRSVHARRHGLMEGEPVFEPGPSPELAQGLSANPGRHKVVMRLSANRARRQAYEMSAEDRAKFNGCPMHEPARLEGLPA